MGIALKRARDKWTCVPRKGTIQEQSQVVLRFYLFETL